jgi:hypothetical protein
MRDEHMERLRQTKGEVYRDDFIKLCANKHKATIDLRINPDLRLHQVFDIAVSAEASLMNDYHDILAVKNALDSGRQALDAINQVKIVHPDRIQLDAAVLDADIVQPDQDFERFKQEIKVGNTEVVTMAKHAERMLEKAERSTKGKLEGGVQMITDIGGGSTRGETLNPDQLNIDAAGTSEGNFKPISGHVVGDDKVNSNNNLYLNQWYVIGPFDNRFRINRDASFLPESVVDLDSKTVGKDNKVIGWEYWRCNKQRIEPTWAPNGCIYYGWTEVYCPDDMQIWVAVGSDDKGMLWLNGKKEWESGNERKPYRADEWVSPLDFKKGRNEILFRCENDGGTMGWSMILLTQQ